MRFSGRLQIEADPANWLKADLMVGRGRVELVAGSDMLGSWSTSQVVAERVEADRFSLQLGDDRALFIADDALGFSYEAMPQLNKRQLIPVGGVMDKLKAGLRGDDHREPAPGPTEPAGPGPSESAVATTGKRLRELIKEASAYANPASVVATPDKPGSRKQTGHSLDAALRWGAGSKNEAHAEPEELGSGDELSTEDLLERLFDAPHAPDRPAWEGDPVPSTVWAESAAPAEPFVVPSPETPVVAEPTVAAQPTVREDPTPAPPPSLAEPDVAAEPAMEIWQKEQSPLEVWHKTEHPVDLSPVDSHWGRAPMGWQSSLQTDTGGSQSSLLEALDRIVVDVKSGAMSVEQVQAITMLVEAITKAVQPKF